MTNKDLFLVFESALAFPYDLIRGHLLKILDALNRLADALPQGMINTMVYGSRLPDAGMLDAVEAAGLLVVEDDLSLGRRNFDLSHNCSSPDLVNEIIHAFSYKPLCPCLRSLEHRFELLYRMLGSYGIETVLLIDEPQCPAHQSHIEGLRIRLMRSGVDPLVVTQESAAEEARRYFELASL